MASPKTSIYLRSNGQDLALETGNYVIGRSPLCNIVIDGPLISRRHAELRVAGDTAIVKDLDSANGVLVNGQRIFGSRVLKIGDKVKIGHKELEVAPGQTRIEQALQLSEHTRGHLSFGSDRGRSLPPPRSLDEPSSTSTRQAGALALVGDMAQRALDAGRGAEAEGLLSNHLKRVLSALQSGKSVDAETVQLSVDFGLKLAELTGNASWLSYSLQILRSQLTICSEPLAAKLRAVILRLPNADADQLLSYARGVREHSPSNLEHLASARRLEELAELARQRAARISQR